MYEYFSSRVKFFHYQYVIYCITIEFKMSIFCYPKWTVLLQAQYTPLFVLDLKTVAGLVICDN